MPPVGTYNVTGAQIGRSTSRSPASIRTKRHWIKISKVITRTSLRKLLRYSCIYPDTWCTYQHCTAHTQNHAPNSRHTNSHPVPISKPRTTLHYTPCKHPSYHTSNSLVMHPNKWCTGASNCYKTFKVCIEGIRGRELGLGDLWVVHLSRQIRVAWCWWCCRWDSLGLLCYRIGRDHPRLCSRNCKCKCSCLFLLIALKPRCFQHFFSLIQSNCCQHYTSIYHRPKLTFPRHIQCKLHYLCTLST